MAAGGPIPLANAYVALHMLRNVHNCSLPVELFFNGTQELDWPTRIFFTVGPYISCSFPPLGYL